MLSAINQSYFRAWIALALIFLLIPAQAADVVVNSQTEGRKSAPMPVFITDSFGNPTSITGTPTGPAGTPNAGVVTVQGITGGTPIGVSDAALLAAVNLVTAAVTASAITPPLQIRAQSQAAPDRAASAITATGQDNAIALDSGTAYAATITVTATGGTNPTLDLILQESQDSGATFKDIYWVARITANGTYQLPHMLMTGQRRWRYVVGGTGSPTFTVAIAGMRDSSSAMLLRQFLDYSTLAPNTGGSTSPTWDVSGCKIGYAFSSVSAQTGAVTIQPFMSPDGTNFGSFGNTVVSSTTNGLVASSFSNPPVQYARNTVTTAGSGVTMRFNGLSCTN